MKRRRLAFESLDERLPMSVTIPGENPGECCVEPKPGDGTDPEVPPDHEHVAPQTHPDYPVPVLDLGHDILPIFGWEHAEGVVHVHGTLDVTKLTAKYTFVDSGATLRLIGTPQAPLDLHVNTIFAMPGSKIIGENLVGKITFTSEPFETWDKYQFGRGLISLGDVK